MMPSVSPSQFAATSTLGRCLLALADSVRGDAINVAARMESLGEPGRIHVAEGAWERLRSEYRLESRGEVDVKGKGTMPTWYLEGPL